MKNDKIVNVIQNIGNVNYVPETINAREVFLTAINGFLYVKPGEDTAQFYKEFRRCLDTGHESGRMMYMRRGKHVTFNKCIRTMTSIALMNCIKEHFNQEYFDSMLHKIDVNTVFGEKKTITHKLGFAQHQELSKLLLDFRSYENSMHLYSSLTASDSFVRLIAKILLYTDINTAYLYAHMLVDLDHALNMDVFKVGNLEVKVSSELSAS